MRSTIPALSLVAAAVVLSPAVRAADDSEIIFHGSVIMWDGNPLPKAVGIERVCSERNGNTPGPITNKEGTFTWRLVVDRLQTRRCFLRATLKGYSSTQIEISNANGFLNPNVTLDPLIMVPAHSSDPRKIHLSTEAPRKARGEWKAAGEEVNAGNNLAVIPHLEAVVAAEPKFAEGWRSLGIVYESVGRNEDARKAYEKALEADPKLLTPYITLGEIAIKAGNWQKAVELAQSLIQLDKKHEYPDAYLILAIAQVGMKDLNAAEASAKEGMNPKREFESLRCEYVLGRILEAKGDLTGAREHIERYLRAEPGAKDAAEIRASLATLGQTAGQPGLLEGDGSAGLATEAPAAQ